jgi:hypothetical protein
LPEILAHPRVRCLLLFAALVFVALPAGSALADTTVGQTGTPLPDRIWSTGSEVVQTDAAMPADGVVTGFHTQSGTNPTCRDLFGAAGIYDFQVLRPLGGDQYRVLGHTGDKTDPCDGEFHTYQVDPTAVEAGDVIGAYVVHEWQGVLSVGSGTVKYAFISEPAVGDTVTLEGQTTATVDESATLVTSPPSTQASALVTDSVGVGPGKALFKKASAIQAAVDAGNTSRACAGITSYLKLVKAQTGKKLTASIASQLTTDATDLAAALGC